MGTGKTTKKDEKKEVVEIQKHETLVEALVHAMLEYEPLKKSTTVKIQTNSGGQYEYSYATLADTRAATDPYLLKHGIVVIDRTEIREGKEYVVTTMEHAHSEAIRETEIEVTASGDMKDLGGNITYARRYNYCNLTGRIGEEDNDARDVQRQASQPQGQRQEQRSQDQQSASPGSIKKLTTDYFKLLSENEVFKDDKDNKKRHSWQAKLIPKKPSTTQWKTKADFTKAIDTMHWRLVVGEESDDLLEYMTTKAQSTKGLIKQFLRTMGVSKLTGIMDVTEWKVGMAAAKLSIDLKLDDAVEMGKVLMRAGKYERLFDEFLIHVGVAKMTLMTAAQVKVWRDTFKAAVEEYNKTVEEKMKVDIEVLLEGKQGTMI